MVLRFGDELDKGTTRNLSTTVTAETHMPEGYLNQILPGYSCVHCCRNLATSLGSSTLPPQPRLASWTVCSPAASSVKLTSVTEAFKAAPRKDKNAGVRGFGEGLGSRRPTNDSKIHPHHLHLSHYLKQEVSKQDFGKTGQHHHRHDETSASHAEDLRLFPRLRLSASRPGSASNWTARFRPALGSCWCLERSVNQMPVPPPVPQRCRHRYRKALLPSPRRKGRQVPPAPCRCSLPLHC